MSNIQYQLKDNMLKAVPQMEKPVITSNWHGIAFVDKRLYEKAVMEYEQHIASLPPDIHPSPEFLEWAKNSVLDRFEEGNDFTIRHELYGFVSRHQPTWDAVPQIVYDAYTYEKFKRKTAYPILPLPSESKEQENEQKQLWRAAEGEAWDYAKEKVGENADFPTFDAEQWHYLKTHFTIQRKQQ